MREIKRNSDNIKIANEVLERTDKNISLDKDVLSEIIDTDIRESLPPQILAVITSIFKVLEDIEKGSNE